MPQQSDVPSARGGLRLRWTALGGAVLGGAVTAWFLRRQVAQLAARAVPYVRRRSGVSSPALIVNRWSGDG